VRPPGAAAAPTAGRSRLLARRGGSPHTARLGPGRWLAARSYRHRTGPAGHGDATAGAAPAWLSGFGAMTVQARVAGYRAHTVVGRSRGHHDRGSSDIRISDRVVEG